jgi:hypothetical protein
MEHMTNDKLTFMQTAASCGMGSKRTFLNKKEAQGPLLEFQGIRAN